MYLKNFHIQIFNIAEVRLSELKAFEFEFKSLYLIKLGREFRTYLPSANIKLNLYSQKQAPFNDVLKRM